MTDQESNRAPLARSCSGAVSVGRGVELSTHVVQTISGSWSVLAQAMECLDHTKLVAFFLPSLPPFIRHSFIRHFRFSPKFNIKQTVR